jgi:nitrogen regulatory protein P-II 1
MSTMKRVEALIRPERLEQVKVALSEAGVTGLHVLNVIGRGEIPPQEQRAGRAGETVLVDLLPKVKLETIVSDGNVENVIAVIREHGAVGDLGDGLIFVSDVQDAVRIRTGERGNATL